MSDVYEVHLLHSIPAAKYSITAAAVYGSTVLVGCDDGALRLFDASSTAVERSSTRTELPLIDTIPKFSRDITKKATSAIQKLVVVHEWAALIVLIDGNVNIHRLDSLSRPPITLGSGKLCVGFAAAPEIGMLAVAYRDSVRMYNWHGSTAQFYNATVLGSTPPKSGGNACGPTSESFEFSCEYELLAMQQAVGADAAARKNSTANILLALGSSTSSYAHAAIVGVSWVDGMFSAKIIRRSDVVVNQDEEEVPPLDLVEDSSGSKADTGYRLHYFFLHPTTGKLLRDVFAGMAPSLDSNGMASALLGPADIAVSMPAAAAGNAMLTQLLSSSGNMSAASSFAKHIEGGWGNHISVRGPPALNLDVATFLDNNGMADVPKVRSTRTQSSDSWDEIADNDDARHTSLHLLTAVLTPDEPTATQVPSVVGCIVEDAGWDSRSAILHGDRILFNSYPAACHASPSFPYIVAAEHDGVVVYHAKARCVTQHVKLTSPFCIATCPVDSRVRMNFAAKRHLQYVSAALDALQGQVAVRTLESILLSPEQLFIVAPHGIVLLRMAPMVMQVAALLSRRPPLFEDALTLCEHFNVVKSRLLTLLEAANMQRLTEDNTTPAAALSLDLLGGIAEHKINEIRGQFGYQKFAEGDFGVALEHLLRAGEPVARVVSLFPQLCPADFRLRKGFPVKMPVMIDTMLPIAVKPFIRYLLQLRRQLRCDTTAPIMADGAVDDEGDVDALDDTKTEKLDSGVAPQCAPRIQRHYHSAVLVDTVLLTSLLWFEAYLSAALDSKSLPSSAETQLVRVRGHMMQLLTSQNCLDFAEAETQLLCFKHGGKELIELYRNKGSHSKALKRLTADAAGLVEHSQPGWLELQESAAVTDPQQRLFLAALGNRLADLKSYILTSATTEVGDIATAVSYMLSVPNASWLLLQALLLLVELGNGCFPIERAVDLLRSVPILSSSPVLWYLHYPLHYFPEEALDFIQGSMDEMLEPSADWREHVLSVYLEGVSLSDNVTANIQNLLLSSTINVIRQSQRSKPLRAGTASSIVELHAQRLGRQLRRLSSYDGDAILRIFPPNCIREKAEVLRHLGRHEDALQLLVVELQDEAAAELYCADVVAAASRNGLAAQRAEMTAVYSALLRTYFPTAPTRKPRVATIVDLDAATVDIEPPPLQKIPSTAAATARIDKIMPFLLQHLQHLEPSKALSQLPKDVSLASIAPFVGAALSTGGYTHHSAVVARQFALTENINAHWSLIQRQAQPTVLDRTVTCSKCGKKISPSGKYVPFARMPDSKVLHLSCLEPLKTST